MKYKKTIGIICKYTTFAKNLVTVFRKNYTVETNY